MSARLHSYDPSCLDEPDELFHDAQADPAVRASNDECLHGGQKLKKMTFDDKSKKEEKMTIFDDKNLFILKNFYGIRNSSRRWIEKKKKREKKS